MAKGFPSLLAFLLGRRSRPRQTSHGVIVAKVVAQVYVAGAMPGEVDGAGAVAGLVC
jgi:hypothetical protein